MNEPIKLVCTAGGGLIGAKPWSSPPGAIARQQYLVRDLPGGTVPTEDPITTAATALMSDGYSPYINFALQTLSGDTLFVGRIGDHVGVRRTG